jgi:hypothetical protein
MAAPIAPDDYTSAEAESAIARARGRCRACRARAIDTVRRRAGAGQRHNLIGNWAHFDFETGRWRDAHEEIVVPHELATEDEIIDLRVVRVAETAPPLYAGRVLVLCQLCDEVLNTPPAAPTAEPLELPL